MLLSGLSVSEGIHKKERKLQAAVDQLKNETEVRLDATEKELKAEVNQLKREDEGKKV